MFLAAALYLLLCGQKVNNNDIVWVAIWQLTLSGFAMVGQSKHKSSILYKSSINATVHQYLSVFDRLPCSSYFFHSPILL